jgi:hypothetical protein
MSELDDALAAKREKASRYASDPERLAILSLSATFRSQHGLRRVELDSGIWSCSCEFFAAHGICSHTLAAHAILQNPGIIISDVSHTADSGGTDSDPTAG